jgi:hypothetical protein
MWGKPKKKPGQCNAELSIADNYGDGNATFLCQLKPGHEGLHQEEYNSHLAGAVTVTWEKDEVEQRKSRDAKLYADELVEFERLAEARPQELEKEWEDWKLLKPDEDNREPPTRKALREVMQAKGLLSKDQK